MKLQLWSIGKGHEKYIKSGVEDFTKRISHYYPVEWIIIPTPKNAGMLSEINLRTKEGETVLEWLKNDDFLIALDPKGQQLTSEGFADLIRSKADAGIKKLIFLIGGAFGLDEAVLKRANFSWSLSKLIFPHQLVRLILSEQIYRACTIIRNEKYHHS